MKRGKKKKKIGQETQVVFQATKITEKVISRNGKCLMLLRHLYKLSHYLGKLRKLKRTKLIDSVIGHITDLTGVI